MTHASRVGRFSLIGCLSLLACTSLRAEDLPLDSDGDGLSDAEEAALGTLPNDSDTDGDGLLDGWEVNGYDSGAGFEPLGAYGANPLRKDVFVEIDWMLDTGGSPQPNAVIAYQAAVDVVRAFRESGAKIDIHFDLGPRIKELVPESILEPDVDFSAFENEPDEEKALLYQDSFSARSISGASGRSTQLSLYDVYFGGKLFRPSRRNIF